uniref:Uncharacterized protein n=1 Tax=viral metagenome TaxID=1070528 RepID=A0A6C0EM68_9ZZZZ
MVLTQICPPALIYLIFSITQVSVDTVQGSYNTALVKIWVAFVFTVLLNYLCMSGLDVVSWLIVFIPFILMTVIVSMLLFMFGLDPTTGKLAVAYDKTANEQPDVRTRAREDRRRRHKLDRFSNEQYARWRKYNEAQGINTGYDQSNISTDQKKVLDDAVSARAGLECDPLHSDCPKKAISQVTI